MTDQITVPRATWDAMREALEHIEKDARVMRPYVGQVSRLGETARQALTAANAVQPQILMKKSSSTFGKTR